MLAKYIYEYLFQLKSTAFQNLFSGKNIWNIICWIFLSYKLLTIVMMPCSLQIVSQSDSFIQIVDINSHTEWQTVQILISLLLKKQTDLDKHYSTLFAKADINSHTEWRTVQRLCLLWFRTLGPPAPERRNWTTKTTVQIQISWLLKKLTDLDLHCLQRQSISGFSRTRVNKMGPDRFSRMEKAMYS